MKYLSVTIDLLPDDMTVMARIADFQEKNTRTPKRWEIVGHKSKYTSLRLRDDQRVFDKLKLLGLIVHSGNGHCWLSDQAKALVATAEAG